jgi:hypothetical protein
MCVTIAHQSSKGQRVGGKGKKILRKRIRKEEGFDAEIF